MDCTECGQRMRAIRGRIDPRTAEIDYVAFPCGHPVDGRTHSYAYSQGLHIDVPAVNGANLIAAERDRQVREEGHTLAKDLAHEPGALAWAAWTILDRAAPDAIRANDGVPTMWPFSPESWKPERRPMRLLIIAAALIAAEIDRRLAKGERP